MRTRSFAVRQARASCPSMDPEIIGDEQFSLGCHLTGARSRNYFSLAFAVGYAAITTCSGKDTTKVQAKLDAFKSDSKSTSGLIRPMARHGAAVRTTTRPCRSIRHRSNRYSNVWWSMAIGRTVGEPAFELFRLLVETVGLPQELLDLLLDSPPVARRSRRNP
jgi:hypothetical protein